MSTTDFLIGQMVGEHDFDPTLFNPNRRSLAHSPQPYVYDHDGSDQALLYLLSGLSGEHRLHGVPLANQFGGTEGDLFSFNTGHQYPPTALNPVIDTASSTSNIDSQTPPPSLLSLERIPKEPKKTSIQPKKNAEMTKQNLSLDEPVKAAPNARRQLKREATKANNNETNEPKETKTKNQNERSLERNRVAASKCRKRKKQWTENLEEKNSGLEAIHSDLQAEYMNLLQESSQLKNLLISHASCQNPNIDN